MTLLLLLAAFLRFYDLGNIPKGLEHDEVATWHMVAGVLQGGHPFYFEEGYGHEPLYNYLTAIPMAIFGHNWLGERFWAPWFGMFAVAATYALMRRLFGPLVGLGAAGFQATVLWAFFFNRLGLRLNLLPFLLTVTAYCFWRGVEAKSQDIGSYSIFHVLCSSLTWFTVAGLLMGLCFYTYMSSVVVWPLFAAFFLYLAGRDVSRRLSWRQVVACRWPTLVCLLVALLVMTPLLWYRLHRPEATQTPQRETQIDVPLRELLKGNLKPVLQNAWALIKMWNIRGELYWQLNYGSRPVFVEPISGVLFWLGLLVALWRWKEPRIAFVLIWFGWGMVPSLITAEAPSWPRTMLASPAALTLPGIAIEQISKWTKRPMGKSAILALFLLSLSLTTVLTCRDYLVIWPKHPRVRYAFQSSLTEVLRYLDLQDDTTPVTVAGLSPHDMDPWTEQCTLRRRDLAVRWTDTRSALVLPPGNAMRLVALDITPVDPALVAWAGLGQATAIARGEWVPRSGAEHTPHAPVYVDPAYIVYRLDPSILRIAVKPAEVFAGHDPWAAEPLAVRPEFGGLLRLEGYTWLTEARPGAPAQLLTFWAALGTGNKSVVYGEPSLKLFVHLLDRDQKVVAGADLLGAAPDTWHADDLIVQLHTFTFPAEPGNYAVELGWYVPPDGPRLPVDQADVPGRRILLKSLEVCP